MDIPTQRTIARNAACALIAAALSAGCATEGGGYSSGGSSPAKQAAIGGAIGAVAGNVVGYLANRDRTTVTVVGALVGAGIGYWKGLQSDHKLKQAEDSSREIADVQAKSRYQYESPKLQARETNDSGHATFDKLETPIPYDAVKNRSADASQVLRKLGALAARNESAVHVYAPTQEARDYMAGEILRGAAGEQVSIRSSASKETKVVIGGVPST